MNPLHLQRGVSLVESLLALAIAIVMLSALFFLLADGQTEMQAKNQAERIQAFQRVAAQYFVGNRSNMLEAMGDDAAGEADEYCRINVPDDDAEGGEPSHDQGKHTCMVDASLLRARRLLPDDFKDATQHGEKLVAIFRRIYNKDGEATENADMVVLTVLADGSQYVANDRRHAENLSIASHLGATGGVLPDKDRGHCKAERSSATYQICGNGWQLSLGDFLSNGQLDEFSALLPN